VISRFTSIYKYTGIGMSSKGMGNSAYEVNEIYTSVRIVTFKSKSCKR